MTPQGEESGDEDDEDDEEEEEDEVIPGACLQCCTATACVQQSTGHSQQAPPCKHVGHRGCDGPSGHVRAMVMRRMTSPSHAWHPAFQSLLATCSASK